MSFRKKQTFELAIGALILVLMVGWIVIGIIIYQGAMS